MKLRYDMIDCYVVRRPAPDASWQILQLHRPPGAFMGETWQTIHGKIKAGETAWQAAVRELAEETALKPDEFYQLDTLNVFYMAADDAIFHCPGFCAVVTGDARITLNHEHDAVRWIERRDIDQCFMWPGERLALAELCREILDDGPAKSFLKIAIEHDGH